MDVVLNSHIALLVLGYLYEEKLNNVSESLCKYSPYLREEYKIIKKGLRPIIINSENLSTIIREHCYIKSKVNDIIGTFPSHINAAFERQNLSGKINHLLKIVKKSVCVKEKENQLKRSRPATSSSSEHSNSTDATKIEDLPGYCPRKKRRFEDSYMFVRHDCSTDSDSEEEIVHNSNVFADENSKETGVHPKVENENRSCNLKDDQNYGCVDFDLNPTDTNPVQLLHYVSTSVDANIYDKISETSTNTLDRDKCVGTGSENLKQVGDKVADEPIENIPESLYSQTKEILVTQTQYCKEKSGVFEWSTDSMCKNGTTNSKITSLSCSNASMHFQTHSGSNNDQILLDLNDLQTFPIFMETDGSMYYSTTVLSNDICQSNNSNLFNNSIQNNDAPNPNQNVLPQNQISENYKISEIKKKSPARFFEKNKKSIEKNLSLECKIFKDKQTPKGKMSAISIPFNKSLSTPRRKSSHVRVLTFSPLKNLEIFNRRCGISKTQANDNKKVEKVGEKLQILEKPNLISESSNSTDLTTENQSNVTVIQRISSNDDTPKRKTSSLSCIRNITRTNSDESIENNAEAKDTQNKKNESEILNKENDDQQSTEQSQNNDAGIPKIANTEIKGNAKQKNKKDIEATVGGTNIENDSLASYSKRVEEKKIDSMEEWKKIREKSKNPNFDQFLREIQSKTPTSDAHILKRRKSRRKIGSKLRKSITNKKGTDKTSAKTKNADNSLSLDSSNNHITEALPDKRCKNLETKTNFLNFRIKTPIKADSLTQVNRKSTIRNRVSKMKESSKSLQISKVSDAVKQPICIETSLDTSPTRTETTSNIKCNQEPKYHKIPGNTCETQTLHKEIEKRTANIAHILDTPFKFEDEIKSIPKTPGVMIASYVSENETPMTSFTSFCNIKNTNSQTPAFAITPGACFNNSSDKETPKSGFKSDSSIGGTYYRPDSSEVIIKPIPELNKKNIADLPNLEYVNDSLSTNIQGKAKEIVSEIIPCPVLLEKTKTFSDTSQIVPHYKFIEAGLPDITDESSNDSSSENSSSFSSSSSSSSDQVSTNHFTVQAPLSLLSNIDSSEDKDWEVQSTSKNIILLNENSRLIGKDGEVRFPVRSWITPKKQIMEDELNAPSSSKQILDRNLKLDEKLERVKAKLHLESSKEVRKMKNGKEVEKGKKLKVSPKIILNVEKKCLVNDSDDKRLDVLTALNLSAKKLDKIENPKCNTTKSIIESNIKYLEKYSASLANDNATSDVFTLRMEEESAASDSLDIKKNDHTVLKMSNQNREKSAIPKVKTLSNLKRRMKHTNESLKNNEKSTGQSMVNLSKTELKEKKINNESSSLIKSKPSELEIKTVEESFEKVARKSNFAPSFIMEKSNNVQKMSEAEVMTEPDATIERENSDSESEYEDEPYEECEKFLSEDNLKNCFHSIFNENKQNKSLISNFSRDMSNSSMKININNRIREIKCCQTINLYQKNPGLEKNLKNKKIENSNNRQIKAKNANDEKIRTEGLVCKPTFKLTSTPLLKNIKITHRNKFSNDLKIAKKKNSGGPIENAGYSSEIKKIEEKRISKTHKRDESGQNSDQDPMSKKNIRNEDIFAVLSHLHGNGK